MKLEQWHIWAILCVVFFVIGLIVWKLNNNHMEGMKETKPVIPLHIYQTWHTKKLPPKMRECVDKLKKDNPEFEHHLYDDKMCKEFIKKNFDKEVLESFNKLKPGAYKADLWRYCIMYINGGIYLDIKYKCNSNFKLIELTDKEYYVVDRCFYKLDINIKEELDIINIKPYYENIKCKIPNNFDKKINLYNGLIVCKPMNNLMKKCIEKCVQNIKNNYYGKSSLDITGPGLMGELYFNGDYSKIDSEIDLFYSANGKNILNRKRVILKHYPEYRKEQFSIGKTEHYGVLWNNKDIYNAK